MHPVSILVDGRREYVPCGKCNFCLEARRGDWSFRIRQEMKVSSSAHFLTLTYAEEKCPKVQDGIPSLRKKDLQDFYKRLRKENPLKLRYYAVGEYGTETFRPHYHSITFNLVNGVCAVLADIWGHGLVQAVEVNDARIHYVTKYHLNKFGEWGDRAPPFAVMSRRPGLGCNYLDTHASWHRKGMRGYTLVNGVLGRLPRYYADKLFTKEEKQELSQQGLSELAEYRDEILRLSKLVENPYEYYVERRRANHDAVKHKNNKFNQF